MFKIKSILSEFLGFRINILENISGGKNSQVYHYFDEEGRSYIAKFYHLNKFDNRDRLEVEFSSLQFLWKHNVRCIPKPILANKELGFAIYEYIDGDKIYFDRINFNDIDAVVNFLSRLKELKSVEESKYLPPASEAWFSINDIIVNIEKRLQRLAIFKSDEIVYQEFFKFLYDKFKPFFEYIKNDILSNYGIYRYKNISFEEQSLSPSDFGFHNAIRCKDGELIFLDFEYFGWDDPAKIISDFLLHPAMNLNENFKKYFVCSIIKNFNDYKELLKRIKIIYPLAGLKWCMIFLNEFVPEHLSRREFSAINKIDINDLRFKQLEKAINMLDKIMSEYGNFPYY